MRKKNEKKKELSSFFNWNFTDKSSQISNSSSRINIYKNTTKKYLHTKPKPKEIDTNKQIRHLERGMALETSTEFRSCVKVEVTVLGFPS